MTFGKWPIEMHYEPDQLRRIERARAIKNEDIIEINKDKLCGVFYGSQKPRSRERYIYYPTIDSCTCGDFVNRHLPCKHMYRLATECDLLPDDCSRFSEIIGSLENCSDDAQNLVKTVLGINVQHNTGNVWVEFNQEHTMITTISPLTSEYEPTPADALADNPFIKFAPVQLTDCTDRHLNELLDLVDKHPSHNLQGNDLVQWCKSAVPEIDSLLQNRFMVFVPFYRNTMKKVFKYLVRKYDWNTYCFPDGDHIKKVHYPCGASFDESLSTLFGNGIKAGKGSSFYCHFPNDSITEQLTLYGHNRCLSGFLAVAE